MYYIKNIVCLAILAIGLTFVGTSASAFASETLDSESLIKDIKENYENVEVQHRLIEKVKNGELIDSNNPDKKYLGVTEVVDPYTQITSYPDGSQTTLSIDFSEATFYDEDGNVIINNDNQITPFNVEGGSWNKGSGFACVTGARAIKRSLYVSVSFNTDFCIYDGAYDKIDRIYAIDIATHDWDIMDQGIFRATENASYSAYGGVKFQFRPTADSRLKTGYLYLRISDDNYWLDSDFS